MQKYAWHLFHYLKLVHLMKFKKLIIISNVQVKKIIEVCVAYHTWSDQLWITRHHIDKNIFLELDQSLTHIKVTDTWNASILWKLFLLLQLVARLNCSVTQTQKKNFAFKRSSVLRNNLRKYGMNYANALCLMFYWRMWSSARTFSKVGFIFCRFLKSRPTPASFLFISFFSNTIFIINCRLQRDSNLNWQSRRRVRWPLDHNRGPVLL